MKGWKNAPRWFQPVYRLMYDECKRCGHDITQCDCTVEELEEEGRQWEQNNPAE